MHLADHGVLVLRSLYFLLHLCELFIALRPNLLDLSLVRRFDRLDFPLQRLVRSLELLVGALYLQDSGLSFFLSVQPALLKLGRMSLLHPFYLQLQLLLYVKLLVPDPTVVPLLLNPLIVLLDLLDDPGRLLQLLAKLPDQALLRLQLPLRSLALLPQLHALGEACVVLLQHADVILERAELLMGKAALAPMAYF